MFCCRNITLILLCCAVIFTLKIPIVVARGEGDKASWEFKDIHNKDNIFKIVALPSTNETHLAIVLTKTVNGYFEILWKAIKHNPGSDQIKDLDHCKNKFQCLLPGMPFINVEVVIHRINGKVRHTRTVDIGSLHEAHKAGNTGMTANLVEPGGEKRQRELEPDIQSIGKRLRRGVLAPPERILGTPPAGDRMRGITVPGLREEDLLYHSRRDDESSSNPSIVVRSSLNCGVSLCLNGGTCVPNPVSSLGFFCMCIPSRAGEFCEKSVGGVISYSALALIITGVILILILVLVSCCAIFGLYIKERDRLIRSLMEKGSALGFCSGERPTSQSLNPASQSHLREHQEYSKQSGRSSNAPASKPNAQPATSSVIQSYKPSTATPSSAKQPMPGTNTEMASQWQKAGTQTYRLPGFHGMSTVRKVMPQEPSDDNWSSSDLGTAPERTIPTCRAIKDSSNSAKTSNDFQEMESEREVEDHSPHLRSSSSPVTYEKLMNLMHTYFEAINTSDPVSPAEPSMVSPPGAKSCRANSPNLQSFNASAKGSDSTASQCGSAHSSPNSPVINWPVLDSGRHYEHIAHCTWSDSDEESEN